MNKKDKPNKVTAKLHKVTAKLRVVITGEFYGDDVTEETLRYIVEQILEDEGFEVDVSVVKPSPPREVITDMYGNYYCPHCSTEVTREMGVMKLTNPNGFCPYCGGEVQLRGTEDG